MRPAKVNEHDILHYFHNLGDAAYSRWLAQVEPFKSQLAAGQIRKHNIQRAIYRLVDKGLLEARGIKKGRIYRITDRGRERLQQGTDTLH